ASATFSLTVPNTDHAPTVANALADLIVQEDVAFTFTVPASTFQDADPYDLLRYAARLANGDQFPSWLQFDAATKTFSGKPPAGSAGSIPVQVSVTDLQGFTVSDEFDLSIVAERTLI